MEKEIKLYGSAKEQAQQLLTYLKDKTIPVESLAQLIPLHTEFFTDLCALIKQETETGVKEFEGLTSLYNHLSDTLQKICEDGVVTSEERQLAINEIHHIIDSQKEVAMHNSDQEHITKRFFAVLGALCLIPITVLAAK